MKLKKHNKKKAKVVRGRGAIALLLKIVKAPVVLARWLHRHIASLSFIMTLVLYAKVSGLESQLLAMADRSELIGASLAIMQKVDTSILLEFAQRVLGGICGIEKHS